MQNNDLILRGCSVQVRGKKRSSRERKNKIIEHPLPIFLVGTLIKPFNFLVQHFCNRSVNFLQSPPLQTPKNLSSTIRCPPPAAAATIHHHQQATKFYSHWWHYHLYSCQHHPSSHPPSLCSKQRLILNKCKPFGLLFSQLFNNELDFADDTVLEMVIGCRGGKGTEWCWQGGVTRKVKGR